MEGSPQTGGGTSRGGRLPEAPACPFCRERETELVNPFGSHASVSTYWCRRCHSPFEILKWRGGGSTDGPP